MAKSLKSAIAAAQALGETVSGIGGVPTDVPAFDNLPAFAFWIAMPDSGTVTSESYGSKRGIHTIRGELHYQLADIKRAIASMPDDVESITDKFLAPANITLSSTVDSINSISYTYAPLLGYAGIETVGFTFNIEVKIRDVIP